MGARLTGDGLSHRSLGDLIGELTDGGVQLVRDEVRLAHAEAVESLLNLKHGTLVLGTGVAIGMCAAGALVACVIMVISQFLLGDRTWLAALIVAVVLGVIGAILARRGGKALAATNLAPHETATSIKETAAWLKHPTRSAGR